MSGISKWLRGMHDEDVAHGINSFLGAGHAESVMAMTAFSVGDIAVEVYFGRPDESISAIFFWDWPIAKESRIPAEPHVGFGGEARMEAALVSWITQGEIPHEYVR